MLNRICRAWSVLCGTDDLQSRNYRLNADEAWLMGGVSALALGYKVDSYAGQPIAAFEDVIELRKKYEALARA
jgi:hypothetical protein